MSWRLTLVDACPFARYDMLPGTSAGDGQAYGRHALLRERGSGKSTVVHTHHAMRCTYCSPTVRTCC